MRRGRIISIAAVALVAAAFTGATGAYAASPQDICKDLQDGKIDGSYTSDELTAFFRDATVQGYCSPIVVVTPPTVTPPTETPQQTVTPPSNTATPPSNTVTPPSGTAPVAGNAPVALTPGVVAGKTKTVRKPRPAKASGVKGTQHTVRSSAPQRASASPLGTTKTVGTLPFTGAQLSLFAVVGLGLLAAGLLLRSTARQRD